MIKQLLTVFAFTLIYIANAGVLTLEGYYQGKNLFVQNPYSDGEFCVVSVFVNNSKLISYPKVSAFEIDLSNLALNTPITIKILHRNECKPKVLNEAVIMSQSRFAFTSVNVDRDALNWSSKGETIGGKFLIQRLNINNMWEDLETIACKGNLSASYYTWDSEHCTGLNQYRVKFIEEDGLMFYSNTVTFQYVRTPVTIYPRRVTDVINFTSDKPVRYSIYNKYGERLKNGKALTVNCADLPIDDHYTIVFDNQKKTFYKK